MQYPDYKYIEIAPGSCANRNRVISIYDITNEAINDVFYTTYFRYTRDILEYLKKQGSLREYNGACFADYLPIDIDNRSLNEAQRIAIEFIQYLEYIYEVSPECISIYFSGSKGFHIEIPIELFGGVEPQIDLHIRFKRLSQLFEGWKFDDSIYQNRKLYRYPNSIHDKSGLYKIPLSHDELMELSMDGIKSLAESQRNDDFKYPVEELTINESLTELWSQTAIESTTFVFPQNPVSELDLGFLSVGVQEGIRNNTAFDHARRLKRMGVQLDEAIANMLTWNSVNSPPSPERELRATVRSAYSYNVTDSTSSGLLYFFRHDTAFRQLDYITKAVLIEIISHVNTTHQMWNHNGTPYFCEPGEMVWSYDKFRVKHCPYLKPYEFRREMKILEEEGIITKWSLGNKKGSKLRLNCFNFHTQTHTPSPEVVTDIINNSLSQQPEHAICV